MDARAAVCLALLAICWLSAPVAGWLLAGAGGAAVALSGVSLVVSVLLGWER